MTEEEIRAEGSRIAKARFSNVVDPALRETYMQVYFEAFMAGWRHGQD